jgi:hypothetical protein
MDEVSLLTTYKPLGCCTILFNLQHFQQTKERSFELCTNKWLMNWKLCGIGRGLIYDNYFIFIYLWFISLRCQYYRLQVVKWQDN